MKVTLFITTLWLLLGSNVGEAADYDPPLTPGEAQRLPAKELAGRVLGNVGSAIVVDVDRPSWGPRPLFAAPQGTPWPPKGPPPLDRLIMYAQPHVTGSQFGLCGADVTTITYVENDLPRIHAEERYGVEYPLEKWPGAWSYDQSDKICKAAKDVKQYFRAPDAQAAYDIVRQFSFIATSARAGRLPFHVSCLKMKKMCEGRRMEVLASFAVQQIADAKEMDCPSGTPKYGACFELKVCHSRVLGEVCEGAYWNVAIVGSFYLKDMSIRSVTLDPVIVVY